MVQQCKNVKQLKNLEHNTKAFMHTKCVLNNIYAEKDK
jgi:hypothetical protein